MSLTVNLGDAKTTIVHPASTIHGRLKVRQRGAAGISEGLVRIAVGFEDLKGLQSDFLRGFAALGRFGHPLAAVCALAVTPAPPA